MVGVEDDKKKKQGAQTGNNPGASAVADDSRQPLDSVNAVNIPTINTAEQTDAIRNAYIAQAQKEQASQNQNTNAQSAQASNLKPSSITTKQKVTPQVQLEQEDHTPFDVEKERQKMSSMQWLKDMNDQVAAIDNEYKSKADKASKYAKATAWGNFFSALGQLAGGGKNTYVAPDQTYLKSALTKADEARKMYDVIRTSNQKAIDKAKNDYLASAEKTYYTRQDAANKGVQARNKYRQEWAKGNSSEVISTMDNSEALQKDRLRNQKDIEALKRGDSLKEDRLKREKDAFINYKDYSKKQNYNLNESEAMRVANLMIKSGNYTKEKLGLLQSFILGQVSGQDKRGLVADIVDYIEQYRNDANVVAILNNSDNYGYGENSNSNNDEDDLA